MLQVQKYSVKKISFKLIHKSIKQLLSYVRLEMEVD